MQNERTDHHLYLALVLAAVAAVASTPHLGQAFQMMRGQPLSNLFPEAVDFAAAPGDPPGTMIPP
jgi:DMSO reductase anchor subunit